MSRALALRPFVIEKALKIPILLNGTTPKALFGTTNWFEPYMSLARELATI
jgi:hypothetical protein